MPSPRATAALLRHQPLFAGCSRREVAALSSLCTVRRFRRGQLLTAEGQVGHDFYALLDGGVAVDRHGEIVGQSFPGTAVGERSLLTHTRRNATVTATSTVDALVFAEFGFYAACNLSAGFEQAVLTAARAHA